MTRRYNTLFKLFFGLYISALIIPSCGGGEGGNTGLTEVPSGGVTSTITMKIGDEVSIDAELSAMPAFRSKSEDLELNRSVAATIVYNISLIGCDSSAASDGSEDFVFTVSSTCAGENQIITGISSDGTKIIKKLFTLLPGKSVDIGRITPESTVQAIVVERTAMEIMNIFDNISSIKTALSSLDSHDIISIRNHFDINKNTLLDVNDIDYDYDKVIEAYEIAALKDDFTLMALETQDLGIITTYNYAIKYGYSSETIKSMLADKSYCFFDMGTPDDNSDDRLCPFSNTIRNHESDLYINVTFLDSWPDYFKPWATVDISDISISSNKSIFSADRNEILFSERIKISGTPLAFDDITDTAMDNEVVHTMEMINGTWKITKRVVRTGNLKIQLIMDKDQYAVDEDMIIMASFTNSGIDVFPLFYPHEYSINANIAVIRKNWGYIGSLMVLNKDFNHLEPVPLTALYPNETVYLGGFENFGRTQTTFNLTYTFAFDCNTIQDAPYYFLSEGSYDMRICYDNHNDKSGYSGCDCIYDFYKEDSGEYAEYLRSDIVTIEIK